MTAGQAARGSVRRDVIILAILTGAFLLPFLNKAFSLDDPLFIWSADQIRAHPLDPYGLDVNWYGDVAPMHETTQNPPGAAYVIALASALCGRSEPALHVVFCAIAFIAIAGTYRLAALLSPRPLLAAMMTLFAPAFLVLAGTIMSDVLMLALWVWAIYFWLRAVKEDHWRCAWLAALLASAAILSKYFAIALLPLFAADALLRRPRRMARLLPLALPVVVLIAYHCVTIRLYGHSLLAGAAGYAKQHRRALQWLTGLTLLGGSGASILFYLLTARWRTLGPLFLLGCVLSAGLLYAWAGALPFSVMTDDGVDLLFLMQWALWLSAGALLISFALRHFMRGRRDPDVVLLSLWIIGTATFAVAINWTANSRSMLPMVPALAILASRVPVQWAPRRQWAPAVALALAAVLGLLCLGASASSANAQRRLAHALDARARREQRELRFAGHWGFQYYLQELGYQPVDYRRMNLGAGTLVALPRNNTNVAPLPEPLAQMEPDVETPRLPFLTLLDTSLHAAFHSDVFGPLPFAFGRVPPAQCFVQLTAEPIHDKSLVDLYKESPSQ
jgi:4-amino-4-deoxy-L-arabinose transferase-like glycosyltransferase